MESSIGPADCADFDALDWGGPFQVSTVGVGCDEAHDILDRYFYRTTDLVGSSAFGEFDGWLCFVDNMIAEGWSYGSCDREDDGRRIEYSSEAYARGF